MERWGAIAFEFWKAYLAGTLATPHAHLRISAFESLHKVFPQPGSTGTQSLLVQTPLVFQSLTEMLTFSVEEP